MTDYHVEWAPKEVFEEVAKALDIEPMEVFSALPFENGTDISVIFTPGVTDGDPLSTVAFMVLLRRDADGALREEGERTEIPGFMETIAGDLLNVMKGWPKRGDE